MIITELNMPNVDGIQMITAIRKLRRYPFVPILMLTTESQAEKKCRPQGGRDRMDRQAFQRRSVDLRGPETGQVR
jgi:CheY-like chemotaxis protein